jgi:hypothetical protein
MDESKRHQGAKKKTSSRHRNRNSNHQKRKKKRYGTTLRATLIERHKGTEHIYQQKARERFEIQPPLTGFPDELDSISTHDFDIRTTPISLEEEGRVASFVVVRGEWGWIEGERYEKIREFLETSEMTMEQALSLRKAILQEKSVYSHRNMQSMGKRMHAEYNKGVSIVELSRKYDFPPMNIFRTIEIQGKRTKGIRICRTC